MKKKYQIPESESKFLRTSLICGSQITGGGEDNPVAPVNPVDPDNPPTPSSRIRNANLMEL